MLHVYILLIVPLGAGHMAKPGTDRDRRQDGHILNLSAPISAQIDPIHIDIRITTAPQRPVAPVLDVDIRFLIQRTDGCRRYLTAPQGLRVP